MSADQVRADVVKALAAAGGPTTTSARRIAFAQQRGWPAVAEEVNRALLSVGRRGAVPRVHDQPRRHVHWQLRPNHQITESPDHQSAMTTSTDDEPSRCEKGADR